jgi:hypothetical protein
MWICGDACFSYQRLIFATKCCVTDPGLAYTIELLEVKDMWITAQLLTIVVLTK